MVTHKKKFFRYFFQQAVINVIYWNLHLISSPTPALVHVKKNGHSRVRFFENYEKVAID